MLKWLGIELEGFGSEGSVVNFIINLFCIGLILYFFKIRPAMMARQGKDRRMKLPGNPGVKPGDATECKLNRDAIVKLKEKVGNVEGDIKEIKENNRKDHEKIFDKIEKIRNNRRI
jgi:preprotein translocase subunit YajC